MRRNRQNGNRPVAYGIAPYTTGRFNHLISLRLGSLRRDRERLVKIFDEVVHVLDADGQADELVGDADFEALLAW